MALRRESRRLDSDAAASDSLGKGLYQPYLPRKKNEVMPIFQETSFPAGLFVVTAGKATHGCRELLHVRIA
jgi:hypothetical protein